VNPNRNHEVVITEFFWNDILQVYQPIYKDLNQFKSDKDNSLNKKENIKINLGNPPPLLNLA